MSNELVIIGRETEIFWDGAADGKTDELCKNI